jgi:DNA-binding IclR family transcriptional regulator
MSDAATSQSHIQSIQRAADILRCFTEAEPELGVMEISRRLELHKSTVSRILSTLEHEGLVSQNPQTGKYRLGLGLISMAGVALGRLDVRGAAQPYLNRLVEVTQETINVTVLDGTECVNVERVASPRPIRYVGWIGRRTPLHCTAAGKAILAFTPPEQREALIQLPLPRYTEHTITDKAVLEEALAQVCRDGYATAQEDFEEGFSAIAAPILNHRHEVVGTIAISGPTYRLSSEQFESFVESLLEATGKVSAELGFLI